MFSEQIFFKTINKEIKNSLSKIRLVLFNKIQDSQNDLPGNLLLHVLGLLTVVKNVRRSPKTPLRASKQTGQVSIRSSAISRNYALFAYHYFSAKNIILPS